MGVVIVNCVRKMRNKIISAIGMIFILASCIEHIDDSYLDNITPTPGKEVSLSASLNTPKTRTVYGAESSESIKVKWVHDDLITVYGTTCSVNQADYKVKTYVKDKDGNATEEILPSTPNTNNDGQNYADDLVKTGVSGVQWGDAATSDFYAVYPSVNQKFIPTEDEDGMIVQTYISDEQYSDFVLSNGTVKGIPYHSTNRAYGMSDAIMYAYTKDATPTDGDGNPKTVDLNFKPFSTVLNFTINSWHGVGDDLAGKENGKSIKVQSITLEAPDAIAGDFYLAIYNDGTADATEGTSNKITIVPSSEVVWTYGDKLEFSVFVIPVAGMEISENWKVTIEANDGTRTFSLAPDSDDEEDISIDPGKIHKINVGGFGVYVPWSYDPKTWLTTIPRNVYISDLSLPGAWYATDNSYQNATLTQQYNAGVRAFNIDARLTLNTSTSVGKANGKTGSIPNYFSADWREYKDNIAHATNGTLVLACSGTEDGSLGNVSSIGKTVKEALKELGELAKSNPDEYVEAIITVAQKPFDENTGYKYIRGTVNPQMVLTSLVQVLKDQEVAKYIYGSTEGEIITPETTVKDVCGKVVVKVNINTTDAKLKGYNLAAPMLISEGSMASSAIGYITGDVNAGSFSDMNSPAMYWSNSYNATGMTYYYHQAQATTGTPTIAQRKTAIQQILSKSYSIYNDNTHDAMFQLGIGGWTSDGSSGKTNLASQLNPYVYGIINAMLTGEEYEGVKYEPAPVGAVLMNFATSTANNTSELIKAIIDLNGKYFLNRDVTKPAWPNDEGGNNNGEGGDTGNDNGNNGSGNENGGGEEGEGGEV